MRVLAVEDDEEIQRLLARTFQRNGIDFTMTGGVKAAEAAIATGQYDLVLLDIGLPDGDGLSLARQAEIDHRTTGLVFLTGRADPIDRVVGLEIGADDYISKPFEPRELVARLKATYRRIEMVKSAQVLQIAEQTASHPSHEITFGTSEVDTVKRLIRFPNSDEERISGSDIDVLMLFHTNPGRVMSREEVLRELYGNAPPALDRTVDIRISRLRKKLRDDPSYPATIRTIRNKGYLYNPAP